MKYAIAAVLAGVLAVVLGASVRTDDESAGVSPHIIGGDVVKHLDRPYTARLRLTGKDNSVRYCGAARLSGDWFITAAECLDKEKYGPFELLHPDPTEVKKYAKRMYNLNFLQYTIHPLYNEITKVNNIAVFMIAACPLVPGLPQLPKKSERYESFSNSKVTVSGWTISNSTEKKARRHLDNITSYNTTMVSPFVCKLAYFFTSVSNGHICASSWGDKEVTEDEVGIPLVATGSDSRLTMIGIAASVRPWATWLPLPTVFTNIAPVSEWISQVTGIPIRD